MRPPSSQRWRPTWTNHSRRQLLSLPITPYTGSRAPWSVPPSVTEDEDLFLDSRFMVLPRSERNRRFLVWQSVIKGTKALKYCNIFCKLRSADFLTYPNLSIAIGGDEGGVCMGPAIVVIANGDGQWCCCCVCCCWPEVSPFILSGGVNVPGIIPLPPSEI